MAGAFSFLKDESADESVGSKIDFGHKVDIMSIDVGDTVLSSGIDVINGKKVRQEWWRVVVKPTSKNQMVDAVVVEDSKNMSLFPFEIVAHSKKAPGLKLLK